MFQNYQTNYLKEKIYFVEIPDIYYGFTIYNGDIFISNKFKQKKIKNNIDEKQLLSLILTTLYNEISYFLIRIYITNYFIKEKIKKIVQIIMNDLQIIYYIRKK